MLLHIYMFIVIDVFSDSQYVEWMNREQTREFFFSTISAQ